MILQGAPSTWVQTRLGGAGILPSKVNAALVPRAS